MAQEHCALFAGVAALCLAASALWATLTSTRPRRRSHAGLCGPGCDKVFLSRHGGAEALPGDALAEALTECAAAQELCLAGFGIAQLPAGPVGQLSALTRLDLSRNKLGDLPAEVGQLRALIDLDLSRNELRALPGALGQLTHLRLLNCMANRLTALPEEIGNLEALYRLGLKVCSASGKQIGACCFPPRACMSWSSKLWRCCAVRYVLSGMHSALCRAGQTRIQGPPVQGNKLSALLASLSSPGLLVRLRPLHQ